MVKMPLIKGYELYFRKEDGLENRLAIIATFARFWQDSSIDEIEIAGRCMLGGLVFGHDHFDDWSEILTSSIKTIRRVERGEKRVKLIGMRIGRDLMCATTKSGNEYFFYSTNLCIYMARMLADIVYHGEIEETPGFYLKRYFRDSHLL